MVLPIELDIVLKLLVGLLLGGAIGLEREISKKPAGLRTHILVCLSSILFTAMGNGLISYYNIYNPELIRADPIRIIYTVVVGVSVLNAGIIIQKKKKDAVQNLTTAATLFLVSGLGITIALNYFYLATAITILVLLINIPLRLLEIRYFRPKNI